MKSRTFSTPSAFAVFVLTALMLVANVTESSAQVVKRGVQGGLLGAGVGALIGGGKGAAKGAAVGAVLGTIVGASEKDAHGRPPPPPPGPPPGARPYPVYDNGLIYNIQVSLTRLGYNPGPVDGQFGTRTAEAIRAYEYNNRLPLSGQPSPGVYNHMVQHGG